MGRASVVASIALAVVCVLEARALVALKREMGAIRSAQGAAGFASELVAPGADEIRRTTEWLQALYESPDGLRRTGGLCAGATLDADALSHWVYGTYLKRRSEGATEEAARIAILNAVRETPDWQRAHGQPSGRR
jgi:hypothetical protein